MSRPNELKVGGLARLSSVDWPGELAATLFLQGCPWDCHYCHNPHLIPALPQPGQDVMAWMAVVAFLRSRQGLLDGVVFSGGEPLAQAALSSGIAEVREIGFKIALHTGGAHPSRFAEALPLLDWVGLDIKAPRTRYEQITRVAGSGERAFESLSSLVDSGVPYEVRTTVHPDLLGEAELFDLADELSVAGATRWVLQPFRSEGARPEAAARAVATLTPELLGALGEHFTGVELRG